VREEPFGAALWRRPLELGVHPTPGTVASGVSAYIWCVAWSWLSARVVIPTGHEEPNSSVCPTRHIGDLSGDMKFSVDKRGVVVEDVNPARTGEGTRSASVRPSTSLS
jgi:hypothetical protein